MRPRKIILLAVFSNCVTAGLVRHRGFSVQHDNFRRFLNTSTVASTSDIEASTPVIIPTPSSTSSIDVTSHSSSLNNAAATIPVQGPPTSLPAAKESSTIAPSQAASTANVQSATPSMVPNQSSAPSTSSLVAAAGVPTNTVNESEGSKSFGLESATQQSHGSSILTSSRLPTTQASMQPQGNAQSQISSATASIPSPTAAVQFGPSASAYFDSVTAVSTLATPTIPGVQYPGTHSGNRAMATGFNEIYKKLEVTSQCNPKDSNQATACISGELASCQSDGTYVLKSCPDGQSCYALPNPSGVAGINVACAVPSDAAAQLSAQSKAGSSVGAASQAMTKAQSLATPAGGNFQGFSHLPETQAAQMPVQKLSSSGATVTPNTATPISGKAQSPSNLPETGSIQLPVQKPSPFSQTMLAPNSRNQASASLTAGSVSAAVQTNSVQSSILESHSSPTAMNSESQQQKPTAIADTQPSTSSQAPSSKQSVQTLQSVPAAQATRQSQQAAPTPSSKGVSSKTVNSQQASPAQSNAAPETVPVASSVPTADEGRLFSLPTTTQKDDDQQAKPTPSSAASQNMSKQVPSRSKEEQPAHPTETAQIQPPHLAQAASEALQPTKAAPANPPKSSDDDSGIVVVPVGGSDGAGPQGTKEKIAVPNANPNATPIYITVTVTTTAHDRGPTA